MAIVYIHRKATDNTVFYVGVGLNKYRAYHKSKRSEYWFNVYNKHGRNVEVVFSDLTREQALNAEKWLIGLYGRKVYSTGVLVNMTLGGDGGTLGLKHTEEAKRLMSISRSGPNNANYGKKFPPEYGRRISERMKGTVRTLESKLKQSQTITGRKRPYHSERMKGANAPMAKAVTDGVRIWPTVKAAALDLNVAYTTLAGQLNPKDKRKNLLGLKYVNNEH